MMLRDVKALYTNRRGEAGGGMREEGKGKRREKGRGKREERG